MDMEQVWKSCSLCDAHFRQDQYAEHIKLWHTTEKVK